MNYPLTIRFKLAAISSQISVRDATDKELFYVKQKMFKLKENIQIFRDSSKQEQLFTIQADRVIDFSPKLTLTAANGAVLGSVKRNGRASIWKASYDIELGGQPVAHIKELNPWVKVLDALLSQLPFIGLFTGHILHPKYSVTSSQGTELAVLEKKPAFFEGVFALNDVGLRTLDETNQYYLTVLLMVTTLMERNRG